MFEKLEKPEDISVHLTGKGNKYFDLKVATAGSIVMGGVVYWINAEYGVGPAMVAAGKQAAYTFSMGGFLARIVEYTASYYENSRVSKVMSTIVPSILTIGATYLLHTIKGTPEPFESTIPSIVMAPMANGWWGNKTRNKLDDILEQTINSENTPS